MLELQSRLDEREAQLAAMTAQLAAAGLQPDAAHPQLQCDRASLADISNCGQEQQHVSPAKSAVQVEGCEPRWPSPHAAVLSGIGARLGGQEASTLLVLLQRCAHVVS